MSGCFEQSPPIMGLGKSAMVALWLYMFHGENAYPMISPTPKRLLIDHPPNGSPGAPHLVDVSHDSSFSSILGINFLAQQKDEIAREKSTSSLSKNILSSLDWLQEKSDIAWKVKLVPVETTLSSRWLSQKNGGRGVNGSKSFDQQRFLQQICILPRQRCCDLLYTMISMVFIMGHIEIQTTNIAILI